MNPRALYARLLRETGVRPQRWNGGGGAYFYWVDKEGGFVEGESVYVTQLSAFTEEQWLALARDVAALLKEQAASSASVAFTQPIKLRTRLH